jgi:hypothetical protein
LIKKPGDYFRREINKKVEVAAASLFLKAGRSDDARQTLIAGSF